MASGPISSWQVDGETIETVRDFILGGSKISADGDCRHKIKKAKIMASGPITSWQIDGKNVETVTDFIFLSSKITVDGDCSLKIRHLLPGKKSYGKPTQHIKKQRQHFADKGPYSQSCVFPVVVYRCES